MNFWERFEEIAAKNDPKVASFIRNVARAILELRDEKDEVQAVIRRANKDVEELREVVKAKGLYEKHSHGYLIEELRREIEDIRKTHTEKLQPEIEAYRNIAQRLQYEHNGFEKRIGDIEVKLTHEDHIEEHGIEPPKGVIAPCPNCGSTHIAEEQVTKTLKQMQCQQCYTSGPATLTSFLRHWNSMPRKTVCKATARNAGHGDLASSQQD